MAYLDTTPATLVLDRSGLARERRLLDPDAAWRVETEHYGYVRDIGPASGRSLSVHGDEAA